MRRFAALICGTVLAGVVAAAEPNCAVPYPVGTPTGSCGCVPGLGNPNGCGNPQCTTCRTCQPNCTSTGQPRDIPNQPTPRPGPSEPQVVTRETGFYQAPPRTGSMQGATRTTGLNFGSFTIPEIKLRMPSIELPSLSRSRTGARMHLDSAVAPWVSTGYETVQTGARGVASGAAGSRGSDQEDDTRSRDAKSRGTEDCDELKRKYDEQLRALEKKESQLRDLQKKIECIEKCLNDQAQARSSSPTEVYTRLHDPAFAPTSPITPNRPSPPQPPPDDVRVRVSQDLRPASYNSPAITYPEPRPILQMLPPSREISRLPAP